jgi:hypothetical protein
VVHPVVAVDASLSETASRSGDAFRDQFGGERLSYSPAQRQLAMTPKYEPRIFEGRIMMPDEVERIHQELLEFETIESISDPMRALIEDLWPELVHKLPPKELARRDRASPSCRGASPCTGTRFAFAVDPAYPKACGDCNFVLWLSFPSLDCVRSTDRN